MKGSWPGAGGGACAGGCSRGWRRVASGASVVQARSVSVSRTLPHDPRPLGVMRLSAGSLGVRVEPECCDG